MNQGTTRERMQDLYGGYLWQGSARLAYNKHGTIEGPLFLHQEDGCALWAMGM